MNNSASRSNWRLWCRLCTKDNATNITNMLLKTEERTNEMEIDQSEKLDENKYTNKEALVAAIEKYFAVNLRDDEELPKFLCVECFTYVKNLMIFRDHVAKAQHFFLILQQANEDNDYDANALRLKYGLSNEEVVVSTQQPLPEVHYFDTKPETNVDDDAQEENIFEPQTIITDPLEVPKLRLRIKMEKTETDKVDANETSAQKKHASADEADDETILEQCLRKNDKEKKHVDNINFCSKRKKVNSKKLSQGKPTLIKRKRKCSSNDSNNSNAEDTDENTTTAKKSKTNDNNASTEKDTSKESATNKSEEELLTCDECSMKFKRINVYQKHMKEEHNKYVPKYYTCPHCARNFQQPYKLRNHLLVHKPIESRRVVPCPHCDKKFTSPSMVEFHVNYIHKDVRPFICEECGETCRLAAELKCHILTHTDYAPFQCEICEKRFKEQSRLKKHMHIHDPIKPICIECGLQFSTRFTLKRHMLVHSSEMQHKCDFCGRAFKRAKTLKNHLVLHAGLKPYTCNFCDRTFASGANCRTHKKRAHPEELAALEATGSTKTNKLNIPKLKALKALTKTGENLLPVVSKQSGCFAKDHALKRLSIENSSSTSIASKPKVDLQPFMQPNQYINAVAVRNSSLI